MVCGAGVRLFVAGTCHGYAAADENVLVPSTRGNVEESQDVSWGKRKTSKRNGDAWLKSTARDRVVQVCIAVPWNRNAVSIGVEQRHQLHPNRNATKKT